MIDIRELRIGSTVLFKGERVKIQRIEGDDVTDAIICERGWIPLEELDPIPITGGLLKELGFVEKGEGSFKHWEKYIGEDFFAHAKFNPKTRRCRVEIIDEDFWTNHGNIICYDLHILQNFVYLTTKQELI